MGGVDKWCLLSEALLYVLLVISNIPESENIKWKILELNTHKFKLCATLSSMIKSCSIQDVNHLFTRRFHALYDTLNI